MVLVALFYLIAAAPIAAEPAPEECLRDRTEGMLVGALIGDASGGPLEFLHPPQRSTWTYASLDGAAVEGLASSFRLRSYRQEASAYGAWSSRAAPGTLTDDSRHKIMVMRALRRTGELTARSWAEEILRPQKYQMM